MSITQNHYGQLPGGEDVNLFTLKNANCLIIKITNYGGIITEIHTPDREGSLADVALGKDSLQGYLDGHPYFGTLTGRVAGRIGGGCFNIDGEDYCLAQNRR